MDRSGETGSPGWSASYFMQTTEDVARAVAAAAAAARSPRPSVVFSSKDEDSNSPLKKLQNQFTRVLKGLSHPPEVKNRSYNPEDLTSQKRQWASFQMLSLNHRPLKEPSRLFESMVVVGLHPNCDIQALHKQICARKSEGSGKFRSPLSSQHQSRIEPILEPQVLFAYPPNQQLPLSYKDLLSFCFPEGVEVHAIEKTPSMSELNEILLGQAHLKQSDLSFIFRLQVADDSTLYGCCVLVDEIVQKPPGLISMFMVDKQTNCSPLRRQILTTRRCYCIISRLPFFEFHFGVLNSILTEERLERLTKDITFLDLISPDGFSTKEFQEKHSDQKDVLVGAEATSVIDGRSHQEHQKPEEDLLKNVITDNAIRIDPEAEMPIVKDIPSPRTQISKESDICADDCITLNQTGEKRLPKSLLPLLRYYKYEKLESSSTFLSSTCEDVTIRCCDEEIESEEASFSGHDESSDHGVILKWAKANNYGSLHILCEYEQQRIPARGSTLMFHPLEHLHPLEYYRPDETVLHIAGSTIDVSSCSTSLELAEAHSALLAEEEATALSVQTIACLCGSLRLENVLALFAGALLEKQILVICSNLGILSASVLSIIPLIRPYQWQSLLMPVLPNDMLDFLEAPVPYIVGVKNKSSEVQSKLTNVIIVDANKNQVRSPSLPQLPRHKDLFSSLSPYYSKLVGESYLGRKRPFYECTDVQVEAAKGFLSVLRSYLDSLSSNLRSHTITNVQSNDDKVSLLLKESFIDSYPSRDRPFMKLFVDTQLFSVHTDLVLSFFQKE